MNKIDLTDKVAIVTGGVQGFGLAVVERFINSGAKVIIWENDKKLLDDFQTTADVYKIQTDVSNADSVKTSVNETIKKFNRIDILVNNAGIAGPNHKTWEYPNNEWQKVIDIDLTGVFYCCKYVVPEMIKNNYGRIVNVASIAGKEGNPNAMPYSAAKAGGEELAIAFENTYDLPVAITHCMNVYGERQHPEKYIPNTLWREREVIYEGF